MILFNIEAHRHYSQVYSLNFFTEYFRAKNSRGTTGFRISLMAAKNLES